MRRLTFVMIGLLTILITNLSAQGKVRIPSSIPVHDFAQNGRALSILQALAEKYHVVVGVHGILLGLDDPIIDIAIKDGTLSDVFDAITKADPRFEWQQNSSGSVYFLTRGTPLPLMDVTVHSFDVENPRDINIDDRLFDVPEIHVWIQEHKCVRGPYVFVIVGIPSPKWREFSVHAKDLPFSSILDEVAAQSRTYFYDASQYMIEPCTVGILWGNPQP